MQIKEPKYEIFGTHQWPATPYGQRGVVGHPFFLFGDIF